MTAPALLAHYAIETGWGRSERQFNVGNLIDGPAWTGLVQVQPDGKRYRAYASAHDGVLDAVRLAATSTTYARSWGILRTTGDAVAWYDQLMRDGWHPWSEGGLATYRSVHPQLRATLEGPSLATLAQPLPPTSPTVKAVVVGGAVALGVLATWALTRRG